MSAVTQYFENVIRQGKALFTEKSAPSGLSTIFSINLIRQEIFLFRIGKFVVYFALASILANSFIFVVLILLNFTTHAQTGKLERSFKNEFPTVTKVEHLKPKMKELEAETMSSISRLNSAIEISKENFQVTEKLAGLTRTMPGRTWINQVYGNRSAGTIRIEASYLIKPDAPYQLPSKEWIESLQKDPDFGKNLKKVELKKSSQRAQGKSEVYSFELLAEWTVSGAVKK